VASFDDAGRESRDLERHAADFESRKATYTVSPAGDVIGCVYIYPVPTEGVDAQVLSWIRVAKRSSMRRCGEL
jgi:hypothetical protein